MRKWLNRRNALLFCAGALLALEMLLLTDAVIVIRGGETPAVAAAALMIMLTALSMFLFRNKRRTLLTVVLALPVVLAGLAVGSVQCWKQFSAGANYESADVGKTQIYGERRVMLVVPHQDDDLNILGGVLEEYARYGSELYPVFVTNGDYSGQADIRFQEALQVFEALNVPEDHVIFLGYGDSWKEGGSHIYNAEPGVVMESYFGKTETYGTAAHAAYREGREYTIDNLMDDMKSVILEHRPDVIFCSDYDHHIDHKSTTLLFEKVMGQILKEHPEYRPTVYKAYAYGTAWEAEPDYYAENILSTQNPFAEPYAQEPKVYRWGDRVRFPVDGTTLSGSLVGSRAYKMLKLYSSQGAQMHAARITNGDKVAWRRYSDSLCLNAEISVSSGTGERLNDFMLLENNELVNENHAPYDGVWIPDVQDSEKTVTVKLAETGGVFSLALYDHPSEEHNVLNAEIQFDDGTKMETGPLDPGGAATVIEMKKDAVSSFTVKLLETQGEYAGLTEIEAFAQKPETDGRFIKLMDRNGNFLYDYQIGADGFAELSLYMYGDLPELTQENYSVSVMNGTGSAVLENGVIRVSCPVGQRISVYVTCDESGVSDCITVRNPGAAERCWNDLWRNAERAVYTCCSNQGLKRLIIPNMMEKISYLIRRIM